MTNDPMHFTAQYRAPDGHLKTEVLPAASRADALALLKARGITPISVVEGGKLASASTSPKPAWVKGALAGLVVVLAAAAAWFFLLQPAPKPAKPQPKKVEKGNSSKIKGTKGDSEEKIDTNEVRKPKTASQISKEFNGAVKDFIKKPSTNRVDLIGARELDPDDPDNALRTQTMTEIASLISIEPGEPMPPVPYSFMMEDDEIKAAQEEGRPKEKGINGNDRFFDELKKWKITIKETDDLKRTERKQALLQAQLDLVSGIDEGLSVNDTIRAAYEFRKRAFEARNEMISLLTELHGKEGGDVSITKSMIKEANQKLAAEGIKAIMTEEVIADYDPEAEGQEEESGDTREDSKNSETSPDNQGPASGD